MSACSAISVYVEWLRRPKVFATNLRTLERNLEYFGKSFVKSTVRRPKDKLDQMYLPSRSNSLFLIPKAGNRVLIRSHPTPKQLYPIRSEWSYLIRNPKKSDRIGFGLVSDRICTPLLWILCDVKWYNVILLTMCHVWYKGIPRFPSSCSKIIPKWL